MNDEQSTSGKSVNPAADVHAPRQATPVMDVTPPVASAPADPPVTEAPPETAELAVSDDLAEQMEEANISPTPTTAPVETPSEQPKVTEEPAESKNVPSEGPSKEIQNEIDNHEAAQAKTPQLPKTPNPARTAITIAVILTIVLAAVAVLAYMSSQN